MANAFNFWDRSVSNSYFLSVKPKKKFISAGDNQLIFDLLDDQFIDSIIFENVGFSFELGTTEYRSYVYRNLIVKFVPKGTALIPSDDEACWMAACSLAKF